MSSETSTDPTTIEVAPSSVTDATDADVPATTDTSTTDADPSTAGRDDRGRLVVDALGMACPRPILELAAAMRPLPIGDEALLLADDPAAKVDVPAWARMKRQQVLSLDEDEGEIRVVVRKRTEI